SRPVPALRHVAAWPGRRPDPGQLRRAGRGPGAGLLQRDGDGLAMTVSHAVQQMQVPLLALVLLGACAAKMSRMLRVRSVLVVLDATSLFPPRLRRPATMAVCLTELCLGVGILLTSGRAWHGWAAGVRLAAALFFLIAMCAVVELRQFRPGLGCGCFGDLSSRPPGLRSVLRAGLLGAAALVSIPGGELTLPPAGPAAALDLGILVAEFLLVAAVSPEVGDVPARPFIPPWCRGPGGHPRMTVSPGRRAPRTAFLQLSKAF